MKRILKRPNIIHVTFGFILGVALFGGSAAIAAGILAHPKTAMVYIDGIEVDLKGYLIDGAHYFQLRDLDAALKPGRKDFSVVWDGPNQRIIIDTSRGYDPDEILREPNISPLQQSTLLFEYAMQVVWLTNLEREKAGLPPLNTADDLMEIAMLKAQDMADNNYVSHDSPTFGKTKDLMNRAIWSRYMGENCARGSHTPEAVVMSWMRSESHRANILNEATSHMGAGVAVDEYGVLLWSQFFAIAR